MNLRSKRTDSTNSSLEKPHLFNRKVTTTSRTSLNQLNNASTNSDLNMSRNTPSTSTNIPAVDEWINNPSTNFSSVPEQVASTHSLMIATCQKALNSIIKDGDAKQKNTALSTMEKIATAKSTEQVTQVSVILANNESKRLDLIASGKINPDNHQPIDTPTKQQETLYKFTFKRSDFSPDSPIINPIVEFYKATNHEIQIEDTYTTAQGDVICVESTHDFEATRSLILNHKINPDTLLSQIFTIHSQVVSAHSIKTGAFERSILAKHSLLTTTEEAQTLDTNKAIDFLRQFNPKWFKPLDSIECIEMYGSGNRNNSQLVSLKIHVSLDTFKKFMRSKKPKIMLRETKVTIYEQITVVQCLRCARFDHSSDSCQEEPRCRFCGANEPKKGGHYARDCPKKTNPVCPNCHDEEQLKGTGSNSNNYHAHHATSFKCPLLRIQANLARANAKRKARNAFLFKY